MRTGSHQSEVMELLMRTMSYQSEVMEMATTMMMVSQQRKLRPLMRLMNCCCILISAHAENQDPERGQVH